MIFKTINLNHFHKIKRRWKSFVQKNKVTKMPWKWDPIHQAAFDCIKATIAKEVVLAYPDFRSPLRFIPMPPHFSWERS